MTSLAFGMKTAYDSKYESEVWHFHFFKLLVYFSFKNDE